MALQHLSWRSADGYQPPIVPDAWLPITAQATQFVQVISKVKGLAVKVAPGAAKDSGTAQYMPSISLIEVDADKMMPGVKPEDADWSDALFTARHPLLHGALSHESAHARYTTMVPADLLAIEGMTAQMADVLVLLEESRIELKMLVDSPHTREWLPSLVWDFLGKDVKIGDTPYSAAALAALILARADAGSITWKEAEPFRDLVLTRIDADTLDILRGLWGEYHLLTFDDTTHAPEQISIARRWLEALGMDPDAEPDKMELVAMPMPGEGEEGDGDEEGEGSGSGAPTEGTLGEEAAEAAREAANKESDKTADRVGKAKFTKRQQERDAARTRRAQGERAARKAFPPGVGASASGVSKVTHRKPTSAEVAAAVKFKRHLAKVLWTDRRTTRFTTDRPGGRLRSRGALARSAQKGAGMRPTAHQWVQKKKQVVDEPTLRVGFMTDISGSMSGAVKPMGTSAYIVGNGVNALDGIFASVTFAERVYGVVAPHTPVRDVPVMEANGGWENFREGFAALDHALDLIDGDGVKILVISSDGAYGGDGQPEAAAAAMKLCLRHRVIPVRLDFTGKIAYYDDIYGSRFGLKREPIRITSDMTPEKVANLIGEAIVAEVKHYKSIMGVAA